MEQSDFTSASYAWSVWIGEQTARGEEGFAGGKTGLELTSCVILSDGGKSGSFSRSRTFRMIISCTSASSRNLEGAECERRNDWCRSRANSAFANA